MSKRKLAYVLHGVSLGGVEVALVSAIPQLFREFELKVFCLGRIDPSLVSHLSPDERAAFVSFPYRPVQIVPSMFFAIRLLLRFKPDLMICSLWRASAVGVITKILRKRIQFFSFIHNTAFFHPLDRLFTALALRSADFVLADSQATRRFVEATFGTTISVRVVSFLTHPSPDRRAVAPLRLDREVRFMFLGRINEVKNIPLAIDVIGYLRTQGIAATLDIYGTDDGGWAEVDRHIKDNSLGSAVRLKNVLDPTLRFEVFSQYNFLVQLSRAEGMAMSVAEAMQHGLVCVVTPVGEIPNYSADLESAVLMNIGTSEEWEKSLQKVESVIRDPHLYELISKSCYGNFKGVKTYADSLILGLRTA